MASSSSPASIPDSQLGLSAQDVQTLRYHQQLALSQHNGHAHANATANGSSRAASQASSQGRLLLDPSSLQALSAHFDRLMFSIQQRWAALTEQTRLATQTQHDRAGNALGLADAQIARFHEILRQIDELQVEFDKIRRIGDIVKAFRARVEALDRRFPK
ncbi:uncharacterized protein K452DRAFT_313715 [Aplosporella prunicola CBS 121167]|uniref:Biogenesis of lysosome-related organelles complex 1 subunit CNL1 n=1 Tax=Aplosporella prunicola CBS 121167 TaxID=1176127 RepID=A0A6A6AXW5_9PEZI|nr:uncharacterized protein K452DRAFT_313715 [Aplosporella prunicola CBS 121167]KAF2135804.1 hypothetical protein K452DRAFT_313715 [Aplosporella prunicola CBS 121167]